MPPLPQQSTSFLTKIFSKMVAKHQKKHMGFPNRSLCFVQSNGVFFQLPSLKLTWHLKKKTWKRRNTIGNHHFLLQTVGFREGNPTFPKDSGIRPMLDSQRRFGSIADSKRLLRNEFSIQNQRASPSFRSFLFGSQIIG